jgi:acyl carrier protein
LTYNPGWLFRSETLACMETKDEILAEISASLVELFELEPSQVTFEAKLDEDLEIDSIDAVDLMDRLRRKTGRKISAEDFRSVRTVGELVDVVHRLVKV